MEHGATRNFQAEKFIEEEEKRIQQEREEEELNNPMKVGVVYLNWCLFVLFPFFSFTGSRKVKKKIPILPGVRKPHKGF